MNAYGQNQTKNAGAIGNGFSERDIVINIGNTADAAIIWICDLNPNSPERVRRTCRVLGVSTDPADILNAPAVDAVAIVVPASRRLHP